MNFKLPHLIAAALLILALHLAGVFFGLYDNGSLIDVPQHILGGIILGTIWLAWLNPEQENSLSKYHIFVSVLGFVALGSSLWEIFEFALWNLLPGFTSWFKLYSPTVAELLGDIASSLFGGLLVGIYSWKA